MIVRSQVTFSAIGERFTPSKVGATFSQAHDPGAFGDVGRYRGLPIPYGSADIDVPDEVADKIMYIHRHVSPILQRMRDLGAEDFRLHITYHYADQCALGFSVEELKIVADLECEVAIDCITAEDAGLWP